MFSYPYPSLYHLPAPNFAFRKPIISLFTFHMPEPSQPATTGNSIHTFNTQPMPELFTCSSVLQGHSRHPPNHIIFRSNQPLHIIHLHRPSFATIYKHPLYTRSIYISFYSQGSSPRCQEHFQIPEFSPSTSYSSS